MFCDAVALYIYILYIDIKKYELFVYRNHKYIYIYMLSIAILQMGRVRCDSM